MKRPINKHQPEFLAKLRAEAQAEAVEAELPMNIRLDRLVIGSRLHELRHHLLREFSKETSPEYHGQVTRWIKALEEVLEIREPTA